MSSPGIVPQNVLLLSENKLKNFTDIDPNVSAAILLPFVGVVQQTKLEYIIGAPYYRSLLNQVADNTISGNTTDYNFLLFFVQPALIWWSYAECLPSIMFRIKNQSIQNNSPTTVSISDMNYMQKRADDRAQFFEERMIQEIIFNSNLYPLCYNYTSNQGLFPHLGKQYFSGVHIPNGAWTNTPGYMMQTLGLQWYSDPTMACCGLY
jgi:hypothetical protein